MDRLMNLFQTEKIEMTRLLKTINENNKELEILNKISDNSDMILELDNDQIEKLLDGDKKSIRSFCALKVIIEGNVKHQLNFKISDEQWIFLNITLTKLKEKLFEQNNRCRSQLEKLNHLEKIREKIMNISKEYIVKEDCSFLVSYLTQKGISETGILKILADIHLLNQKKHESKEQPLLKETNLDENVVRTFLDQYGISIDYMEQKEIILMYGNLDKMKAILDYLTESNILGQISTSLASFTYILVFSNVSIIKDMIDFRMKYQLTDTYGALFLNSTDFFEKRIISKEIKEIRKKYQNTEEKNWNRIVRLGCHEDFVKTKDFLEKMNFDIGKIYRNCHSILTYPHEAIQKDLEILNIYGFQLGESDALSIIGKNNQKLPILIDQYLELGLAGYVQRYPSCLSNYTNRLLQNLYYKNKNNENYFNGQGQIMEPSQLRSSVLNPINPADQIIPNLKEKLIDDGVDYKLCDELVSFEHYSSYERCLMDERIADLEEYRMGRLVYKFGDILVSRIKVLKIMSDLFDKDIPFEDALIYAITHHSILGENDYNEIRKFVKDLNIQKEDKPWSF